MNAPAIIPVVVHAPVHAPVPITLEGLFSLAVANDLTSTIDELSPRGRAKTSDISPPMTPSKNYA